MELNTLIGVGLILAPFIWYWWAIIRTRNWPTTDAKVIEVDPKSIFERSGKTFHLNLDKDYAIEYSVNGKLYVQTPDIENNVRIAGIKVHKEASVPENFRIRYNPANPNEYSYGHAISKGTMIIMFLAFFLFGLLFVSGIFNEPRS